MTLTELKKLIFAAYDLCSVQTENILHVQSVLDNHGWHSAHYVQLSVYDVNSDKQSWDMYRINRTLEYKDGVKVFNQAVSALGLGKEMFFKDTTE